MQIIVADDEVKVRSALQLLLEQEFDLSVIDEATGVDELLHKVAQREPDLLLLDWELPELTADHLVTLHSNRPNLKIIALSGRPDARQAALAAGVDAFTSKVSAPDLLTLAIRTLVSPADNGSRSRKKSGRNASGKVLDHGESGRTTEAGSGD